MKFTQLPQNAFDHIQMNAGILLSNFEPSTGTVSASDIIGATSGGVTFSATPTYTDYGEDIDNCPTNMLELKKLDSWEAKLSGSFVTISDTMIKTLLGAASTDGSTITPRNDLTEDDFSDIWWVGDYSQENGDNGGFIAVQLMNGLSTGGFTIKSSNKGKGTFDFEFTGHYSMDNPDLVPFKIYAKSGNKAEE